MNLYLKFIVPNLCSIYISCELQMYRSRRKNKSRDEEKSSKKLEASSPSKGSRRSRTSYDPSPSRSSRSRTYEPSPSRSSRSRNYEPSPSRSSRARTYEPSPSRTHELSSSRASLNVDDKEMRRRFEVSPLRISFRSRRAKESLTKENTRENRRYFKVESSPVKDLTRSNFRSIGYDVSPNRDKFRSSIRSRKFDISPVQDTMRFNKQDFSPVRENIRREGSFRRSVPSPTTSRRNKQNMLDLDSYFEDDYDLYGSRKSLDYMPSSPRLRVRAVNYGRIPLRELPTSAKSSQSYRVSCTSRDDESDLHYLTMVREVLLGDPIKGNTQQPAQILPHMYIGNQSNAESLSLLRQLGITHVLNCAGFKGPRKNPDANPYEGLDIDYLEFKADDRDGYDMSQHFDEAFRYLDNIKRNSGTCLVHCALGINRSGVTVIAYLMIHSKWPLLKAVEFVKKRRGVVLSNHGFQRLLIRFARQHSLLDPLHKKYHNLHDQSPAEDHRFLHHAKYGQWEEALDELKHQPKDDYVELRRTPRKDSDDLKRKPKKDYGEPLKTELGTDPGSALMYRYARFMNRDKV